MVAVPASVLRHWLYSGPYDGDAEANAIHHLKRYDFRFDLLDIVPPPGFEMSKEDKSAVMFLTTAYGYRFHPNSDRRVVNPLREAPAT
jgi:hypothetical protein